MAYPMIKADCTDGKCAVEIISLTPSMLGKVTVITWCPEYGTLHISTEHVNGTKCAGIFETKIPELAQKEFRKTKMRRFIDTLLDVMF